MFWTYLFNSVFITQLTPTILTFECVEVDKTNNELLNKLKNGYIELVSEGFFDGFTNNYDMLFISSYSPDKLPNTKEKLFEIKLTNK